MQAYDVGSGLIPRKVSLSHTANRSPPPVWTPASAQLSTANLKRTLSPPLLANLVPAALWPGFLLPAQLHSSKSVNCKARGAQGRKSSESCSPVCCCCRNQDILPAPHRNSRDFFFLAACTPLLPLKVIPSLVALSPPGSAGLLFFHQYLLKCVAAAGKRDLTTVMIFSAFWQHTSSSYRLLLIEENRQGHGVSVLHSSNGVAYLRGDDFVSEKFKNYFFPNTRSGLVLEAPILCAWWGGSGSIADSYFGFTHRKPSP